MDRKLVRRFMRLYFRSALDSALRLFAPRGEYLPANEPVLDKFSIVRGTVGVLALVMINGAYGVDLGGIQDFPFEPPSLADGWILGMALLVILPLAAAVLCATRHGYRRHAARRLLQPVRAVICLLLAAAVFPDVPSLLDAAANHGLAAELVVHVLLEPLAVIWSVIFMWCALWCCVAGPFRTADGHPLLAPAAATALAWLSAIHGLTTGGPQAAMPSAIYLSTVLGGPATVTALSGFEVWQLRDRFPGQFPFRKGPLVAERSEPPWAGTSPTAFYGQQLSAFVHQLKEMGQRLTRTG